MEQSVNTPLLQSETPATRYQKTQDPSISVNSRKLVGTDIRIYQDGLLRASCRAHGIAPARLFASIDPLPYPVNSRMEIEFVIDGNSISRLPATVIQRSTSGINLRIDSGFVPAGRSTKVIAA